MFCSCDASLAKTPFVIELSGDWINSKDARRRFCGYGLLYEVSKFKTRKAPEDAFFLEHIKHIGKSFAGEQRSVRLSMGGALMGIGKRNAKLNAAALKLARTIGPIDFSDEGRLPPFNVVKHLTNDHLRQKLGV